MDRRWDRARGMVSKGRSYDRRNRVLIMEQMAVMLRMYGRTKDPKWKEIAAEMGQTAKLLGERIKNHDYAKEDAEWGYVDKLEREAVLVFDKLKGA